MNDSTLQRLTLLLALSVLMLLPATAMAQDSSDPWDNMMATDRPGFADSSVAVSPGRTVVELGLTAEKPAGADFAGGMNLTARYGIFDSMEVRARVPGLKFVFEPDRGSDSGSFEIAIDSIDLGVKLSLPISGIFTVGLIPYIVIPPGDGDVTPFSGVGAGMGVVAQLNPIGSLVITAFAAPKVLQYKSVPENETAFELDTALQIGGNLTREFAMFGEVIAVIPGSPGSETYMGTDFGFSYYFTPNLMMDLSAGVFFQDTIAAFGGLGVSFQL